MMELWAELERFLGLPVNGRRPVLLLDYDGTLSPFTPQRDAARPYPEVEAALEQLHGSGHTRLVIVTGRPVDEVLSLLPLADDLEVFGSHGLERRAAQGLTAVRPETPAVQAALDTALQLARGLGLAGRLERKPGCAAVHWRGEHPEAIERIRREVGRAWAGSPPGVALRLKEFDGGLELRWETASKARVVETVRREEGPGGRLAYLGDDLTDEDAFRALGNGGLAVLVRPEYRATAAAYWIKPPAELVEFLARWDAATARNAESRSVSSHE